MHGFSNFPMTGSLWGRRQIGNAVPIGLARAIGQMLVAVANKDAEIVVKRTRGTSVHDKIQNAIRIGGMSKC